jgi:hypothetical protein
MRLICALPTIGKNLLRCRVIGPPQELVSYALVLPFSWGANDNAGAAIIHQLTVVRPCHRITAIQLRRPWPYSASALSTTTWPECASTLRSSVYTIFEDYRYNGGALDSPARKRSATCVFIPKNGRSITNALMTRIAQTRLVLS